MYWLLAQAERPLFPWPSDTLGHSVLYTVIFGMIGIALAVFGFKIFDWLTPGNLQEEVLQKNNIAAAILAGAFLIGICVVIAAALVG